MITTFSRLQPEGIIEGRKITGSTINILDAAKQSGIRYREIPGTDIFELKYKGHTEYFFDQVPPSTTALGFYILRDKRVTNNLLKEAGISVPKGYCVVPTDSQATQIAVFHALTKPVVVKTTHGSQGIGVFVSITNETEMLRAIEKAFLCSMHDRKGAIIEQMFAGKEYRILATNDKVVAIVHRVPAHVVGDGVHTIFELIQQKNKDPRREEPEKHGPLTKIVVDQLLIDFISLKGFSLSDVPLVKESITLRAVSNISQGGDSIDYTDKAHESVNELAMQVMQALPGVHWAGIDLMTTDITKPQTSDTYCIIEVNSSPGLDIHDEPFEGENRHAAAAFINQLFPEVTATTLE